MLTKYDKNGIIYLGIERIHVRPNLKLHIKRRRLHMTTELRQAINKFNVAGVVKEAKDFKVNSGENENGAYSYIAGKLVIKAGDTREITVKTRANQFTKKGDTNHMFETLSKFMDGTYPTMATPDVTEEMATKVSIYGNKDFTPRLADNIYYRDGQLRESISFDLGFGKLIIKDNLSPEEYKAEFEVEMFVKDVQPEVKGDTETGRTVIEGYVPVYGGSAMPIKVVAEDITLADGTVVPFASDVLSGVYPEQTYVFWGDIRYDVIETTVSKGGSLGIAKIETKKETVREFVTVGGDMIVDPDKMYTSEQIQVALVERENRKQQEIKRGEENAQNQNANRGVGLGGGAKPSPVAGRPVGAPVAKPTAPVAGRPTPPTKPTAPTAPKRSEGVPAF